MSFFSASSKLVSVKLRTWATKKYIEACSSSSSSSASKTPNISVLLNGVKPQSIKEEDYVSKQQMMLLEKLKTNGIHSSTPADEADECSIKHATNKCCINANKSRLECAEDYYFHKQNLDEIQIFTKNCKTKSDQSEDPQ